MKCFDFGVDVGQGRLCVFVSIASFLRVVFHTLFCFIGADSFGI